MKKIKHNLLKFKKIEYKEVKRQKMTVKTGRKYVNILDVKIDSTSMNEVLTTIGRFWQSKYKFSLFTPNPEILIEAGRNKDYRKILNSADINIPDGVGLNFACKFLFGKTLKIIPGRKLFMELIEKSRKENKKVFLLGGLGNEAALTKEKLERDFVGLNIKSLKGPKLDRNASPINRNEEKLLKEAVESINNFGPDVLFVGFGAPKQEKWIYKWLPKLEVGGVVAVGGTFSYISDNFRLPPGWMERFSIEWLWRLLYEPKRVLRILKAVIVFPLKVVHYKFYRKTL